MLDPIRGRTVLLLGVRPDGLEVPGLRLRPPGEPFDLAEMAGVGAVLCTSRAAAPALALLVDRGAPVLAWGEGAVALMEALGGAGGAGTGGPVQVTPEGAADPLLLGSELPSSLSAGFATPLPRACVVLAVDAGGTPAAVRAWGLPAYGLRFAPGALLERFLALYTDLRGA